MSGKPQKTQIWSLFRKRELGTESLWSFSECTRTTPVPGRTVPTNHVPTDPLRPVQTTTRDPVTNPLLRTRLGLYLGGTLFGGTGTGRKVLFGVSVRDVPRKVYHSSPPRVGL